MTAVDSVRATQSEMHGPGVPRLLEHLAAMAGESVYLWHCPPPAGEALRWRVWTGHPVGSSGGEWGSGPTAYEALQDAFRRLTDAIFDGRVVTGSEEA